MNINLTLIGQAIAFAIFVAFCMKFVWPPLINAISERQRKIADGLNAAEKAKADLADAQAQVKAELDARVAQRTAKLEASLGKDNEQVATLLASTQTLSDEQFDVIAKSLEVKQETQEKQFAEIGGEGQDSVKQLTLEEQLAQTAEKMSKKA